MSGLVWSWLAVFGFDVCDVEDANKPFRVAISDVSMEFVGHATLPILETVLRVHLLLRIAAVGRPRKKGNGLIGPSRLLHAPSRATLPDHLIRTIPTVNVHSTIS